MLISGPAAGACAFEVTARLKELNQCECEGGTRVRQGDQPTRLVSERIGSAGEWQEFVNFNFPWLELSVENRREFHANVRLRRVGERMAGTISPDSCGVVRTERRARQAEAGYLKVLWHLNGKIRVEQDRRCSSLVNGDVTVCDTARPYQVWVAEDAKFAVLTLPYAAVPSWERLSQKLCGSVLRDRVTTRAALAAMISLLSDSASYQPDGAEAVMQAVQWMISASLHCSGPSGGVYGEAVSSALKFDAAHQHVLAHIDDPKLGPDELADALHISRRKLYLIFKAHELTPARFIHNVRLDAVKRALATLDNADRSIFRIAIDYGFTQSASFSRAFKTSFGLSPRAWRMQTLCARPGKSPADPP
jgi:AraC family transcriptional activator of tynA and feaB